MAHLMIGSYLFHCKGKEAVKHSKSSEGLMLITQEVTEQVRLYLFHLVQDSLECVNGCYWIGVDTVDAVHLQAGHITDRGVTGAPAAYPQYVGLAP